MLLFAPSDTTRDSSRLSLSLSLSAGFLDTCAGNARKIVKNHGVELLHGQPKVISRVCELAAKHFRKVPVLIITTGGEQMTAMLAALRESPGGIPAHEVQRFSQFDEHGRSMEKEWQGVIEDATRRLGGSEDSRCRVTVTDKFGGRGHDFQVRGMPSLPKRLLSPSGCSPQTSALPKPLLSPSRCSSQAVALPKPLLLQRLPLTLRLSPIPPHPPHSLQVVDKEANANGGMLVIATSVPDEREWIQWKGRTARQDRPGQFYVILDESGAPFNDKAHGKLASKLKGVSAEAARLGGQIASTHHAGVMLSPADAMVEMMLGVADENIGGKLRDFADEQATGERLNEMTEKFYRRHPRTFDDDWPSAEPNDLVLRSLLEKYSSSPPNEIRAAAKRELGFDID